MTELKDKFVRLPGSGSVRLVKDKEKKDLVQVILSNPTKRNAFSGPMMVAFHDLIQELEQSHLGVKGLLLRTEELEQQPNTSSRSRIFCSGGDLETVSSIGTPEDGALMSTLLHDALIRLRRLPLVSVCLINGRAIGATAYHTSARGDIAEISGFFFLSFPS